MQERENAIVQLEVRGDQTQQLVEADPLQRERDAELQNLEQDIADMAETFTEVHKLVHEQAEVIGKHGSCDFFTPSSIFLP